MYTYEVIAEIRHAAGLTQAEMADEIGVTDRTISHYELSRRRPKVEHAREIIEMTKRFGLRCNKTRKPYTLEDIYGA